MFVDLTDGKCRSCGGQREITGADDGYTVETDAFNDGGIKYWPQAMLEFSEEL